MKSLLVIGVTGLLLSCYAEYIPEVNEEEVSTYEKAYMAEYETFKQQHANDKESFKWVQPKNKKKKCEVYVGIDPNNDKTTKSDYSLYWDGECKDGYAYGLGREIETTMLTDIQQIGYYNKGKAIDYCVHLYPLNNDEIDGECRYDHNKPYHYARKSISEQNGDLQITYIAGVSGTFHSPQIYRRTHVFSDIVDNIKQYPNFSYIISDFRKDEFFDRNYQFDLRDDKTGKGNGFGFASYKNGQIGGGEIVNGTLDRRVQLPQSYIDKANSIFAEIKNEANIALEAQKKALIIKEKYKNKICGDNVKVNFMNNHEYKSICHEDERNAELKTKIDVKLAQINEAKAVKRAQLQQQQLIQENQRAEQIREAEAARREQQAARREQLQQEQNFMMMSKMFQ